MTRGTRIPSLGPRGEGWVALQFLLLGAIVALGLLELAGRVGGHPLGSAAFGVGLALILAGLTLGARAGYDLRHGLSPFPSPLEGAPLVETGAFRWIRHPIYSGLLLASLGWGLATGSGWVLLATVGLALVLDAKSRREEEWLSESHPGYEAYQRRTRRFVPFVY